MEVDDARWGDRERDDVVQKEMELLTAECRAEPERVLALLHPDFVEFGASGRAWDRAGIANALEAEGAVDITAHDLDPVRLAEGVILLTYRTESATGASLRASLGT